jgi:hypothetical protein
LTAGPRCIRGVGRRRDDVRAPRSRCRCGRGEPSPGADMAGVGPVPMQTWQGWAQSRRRCGRGEPSPGADVAAGCERTSRSFGSFWPHNPPGNDAKQNEVLAEAHKLTRRLGSTLVLSIGLGGPLPRADVGERRLVAPVPFLLAGRASASQQRPAVGTVTTAGSEGPSTTQRPDLLPHAPSPAGKLIGIA